MKWFIYRRYVNLNWQDARPSLQFYSYYSLDISLWFYLGKLHENIDIQPNFRKWNWWKILYSRENLIRVVELNKTNIDLVTIFALSWLHVIYGHFNLQLITV